MHKSHTIQVPQNEINPKATIQREIGDNGLFNQLVPKVLHNVCFFDGLTTLGTFTEFWFIDFKRLNH